MRQTSEKRTETKSRCEGSGDTERGQMIVPPGQAKVNDFNLVGGPADTKNILRLKEKKREGIKVLGNKTNTVKVKVI